MKIFVTTNLEMYGCPFEIVIFTDTIESAKARLKEKYSTDSDFVDDVEWKIVDDNLYEAGG